MRGGDHSSKSAAQLKAQGTFRKDRHADRLEIKAKPVEKIPAPPTGFDASHTKKWNEVCQHLLDFEILALQDYDAIQTYVEMTLLQKRLWAKVQKDGTSIEGKNGAAINPDFKSYLECEKIIKPLREQFGFTPRARQGIKVKTEKKADVDPFAALLKPGKN